MKLKLYDLNLNKIHCVIYEVEKVEYSANIVIVYKDGEKFFRFNIMEYNFTLEKVIEKGE